MAITRGMKLFAARPAAIYVATSISARAEDGWIVKNSAASVAETADKLVAAGRECRRKGLRARRPCRRSQKH